MNAYRRQKKLPAAVHQRGFTLIEILVAFTIMAMVIGGLMRVFAGGLTAARHGETYSRAIELAQSKLAEVSVTDDFSQGSRSGLFDGEYGRDRTSYRWRVDLDLYPGDEYSDVHQHALLEPWLAAVDVTWQEGERSRNVSLTSIILKPAK